MNRRGTWQLILMAREGDRNAIDELIFASFPSAYLILFNILGDKDTVLRVLSDVYVETFLNLDKLQKSEDFFEVIHKKAIEKMMDDEKCKITLNHDKSLCEKASEFSDDSACFYDFNSLKDIDTSSTADCIFTVLNTLSLEKRLCLYLYYFVSISPEAIASIISSDEEQVKGTLAVAFSEAVSLLKKVCEKSDILENVNEKSVILWANRNTKEFSLPQEEMESFYSGVIKSLIDSSLVDTPIAGAAAIIDDKLEVKSMKLTKNKDFLKSVFNWRNFIILLVVAAVAGIVITMNQLDEYNKRRQEREALTNRTTLRYTTT
ncbi:MAG: hypothetical protein IKV88_00095, partial [Clostridia bacterium]|nr:hypothetical protein [Clostridia bacterium]